MSIALSVAACKIQILGGSGGIVRTNSTNYTCKGGETCEIDVQDETFEETFYATADAQYIFRGWQRGPGRLCGSKRPRLVPCKLSTNGFDIYPELMAVLGSDTVFYLEPAFEPIKPINVNTSLSEPLQLREDLTGQAPGWVQYVVFDRDNDGDEDLLQHYSYLTNGGDVVKTPGKSSIIYLENENGVLKDKTETYFGRRFFDDIVRKIVTYDINEDGYLDIIFASNNEDGRSTKFQIDVTAPIHLFLSNGQGAYEEKIIGYNIWTHDVSVADIDNDGIIEIVDAGFFMDPGQQRSTWQSNAVYEIFSNGDWQYDSSYKRDPGSSHDLSVFSAQEHNVADYDKDGCIDLVSTGAYPNVGDFVYFKGDCLGGFSEHSRYLPGSEIFEVKGVAWNKAEVNFKVAEVNGEWIGGVAIYWSETFDVDMDGDLDVLYSLTGFRVAEQDRKAGYIYEDNGTAYNNVFLLKNEGGTFNKYQNAISNLVLGKNLYWSRVDDINGDRLPDLVFSEWNIVPSEAIYINQGDGSFQRLKINGADSVVSGYIVPIDFSGDNRMDFIGHTYGPNDTVVNVLMRGQPN